MSVIGEACEHKREVTSACGAIEKVAFELSV